MHIYNFSGDYAFSNNYTTVKLIHTDKDATYRLECQTENCESEELLSIIEDSIIYVVDYPIPTKFVAKPMIKFYQEDYINQLQDILSSSQTKFSFSGVDYILLGNGNSIYLDSTELVGSEGVWFIEGLDSELFLNIPGYDGIFFQIKSISNSKIDCLVYGKDREGVRSISVCLSKG